MFAIEGDMDKLSALRKNLKSIFAEYSVQRNNIENKTEKGNRLAHAARLGLPDFGEILQKMALVELQPLISGIYLCWKISSPNLRRLIPMTLLRLCVGSFRANVKNIDCPL